MFTSNKSEKRARRSERAKSSQGVSGAIPRGLLASSIKHGEAYRALQREDTYQVRCQDKFLIVKFLKPQMVMSWAIVRGGKAVTDTVVSYQVDEAELKPPTDAKELLQRKLDEVGYPQAVGFMTSRRLDSYVDVEDSLQGISVRSIATVGLSNALRVGDPTGVLGRIGTVNILVHISIPLSEEAFLESMSIAVEARTTAILESGILSRTTGARASGTGTDCVAIAAPISHQGIKYAGKYTALGHLIGSTVLKATSQGCEIWKKTKAAGELRRNG